jgi:hypothetical protein
MKESSKFSEIGQTLSLRRRQKQNHGLLGNQ